MTEKNLFELLREKSILAILDGDTEFGEIESDEPKGNIKISMPYLSGPPFAAFPLVSAYLLQVRKVDGYTLTTFGLIASRIIENPIYSVFYSPRNSLQKNSRAIVRKPFKVYMQKS